MNSIIYADCNATWPTTTNHLEQVISRLSGHDGNPSSIHGSGREAKIALEQARTEVAEFIGIAPTDLTFTSGATEANNLVLQGLVNYGEGPKPHYLVSAIDHPAVIDAAKLWAERGLIELDLIPVESNGQISPDTLKGLIKDNTALVAIMHANNEVGVINDIAVLAETAKAAKGDIHFHSDMVQSLAKFELSWLAKSQVDSAAFSGHKIGAFKGVGGLFLRPGIKLNLLFAGGGQERSKRPGTENLPGIYSLAQRAQELQGVDLNEYWQPARDIKFRLADALQKIEGFVLHSDPEICLPNTFHFHMDGVAGDDLLLNLDLGGVQASSGSACSSGSNRPSHVLKAMGYDDTAALNSVRLSFLPQYDASQDVVGRITDTITATVERIRA